MMSLTVTYKIFWNVIMKVINMSYSKMQKKFFKKCLLLLLLLTDDGNSTLNVIRARQC